MNLSIFNITRALEDLLLSLPESGEMSDEQAYEYENLSISLEEKQKGTLYFFRDLELKEEMLTSEIKRLESLKTQITNKKASIQKLVEYGMDKLELNELNFGSIKAVRKLNPPSVVIDESVQLPAEYTKQTITITPDKAKIKDAIKSGLVVEGARLVQNTRIEIK